MNVVGANIKKYREKSGLSQQDLAKRIAVTRQTISNWERGVSLPDIDTIMVLAKELHVYFEDMLYKERPIDEFVTTRPTRVKVTFILGFILFVSVLLNTILVPYYYANRMYNMTAFSVLSVTVIPFAYMVGSIFSLALLSIWFDFRINSRTMRMTLIILALSFIMLYYVISFLVIFGSTDLKMHLNNQIKLSVYFNWLVSYPVIFIFPGTMLFCGFNKKPPKKAPIVQKVDVP